MVIEFLWINLLELVGLTLYVPSQIDAKMALGNITFLTPLIVEVSCIFRSTSRLRMGG
jgi:hypothetical protein